MNSRRLIAAGASDTLCPGYFCLTSDRRTNWYAQRKKIAPGRLFFAPDRGSAYGVSGGVAARTNGALGPIGRGREGSRELFGVTGRVLADGWFRVTALAPSSRNRERTGGGRATRPAHGEGPPSADDRVCVTSPHKTTRSRTPRSEANLTDGCSESRRRVCPLFCLRRIGGRLRRAFLVES